MRVDPISVGGMDKLLVEGGRSLAGSIEVPAAKNASLPLMCLSLLTDKPVCFSNLPEVSDILSMKKLLETLGARESGPGRFHCQRIETTVAHYDLVRKMRASILVLGPLLARSGSAEVSLPGGCAIGERPIDIHLKGMKSLGAEIKIEAGYVHAKASRLKGAKVTLDFPSVTGTINILMAAALAEGESLLENVAQEPEIVEVAEALRAMGSEIEGEGTGAIRIQGRQSLDGLDWQVQPDRIQSLTYLAAAAITQGKIECRPYRPNTMNAVLDKFKAMGCVVEESAQSVSLQAREKLQPVDIETAPFPGFPTDGQAQFMASLCLADPAVGSSHITETVFENRFQHASELRRMGAKIKIKGNLASVQGVDKLTAASVMASDLRASASLVLAGLAAEGTTEVLRVYHLDRGYERLEEKLNALGASIRRVKQ